MGVARPVCYLFSLSQCLVGNDVHGDLWCSGIKSQGFPAGGMLVKVEISPHITWRTMGKVTVVEPQPPGNGGCVGASPEPTGMCLCPHFSFTFSEAWLSSESHCSRSPPFCKTALSKVPQRSPCFLGEKILRPPVLEKAAVFLGSLYSIFTVKGNT